MAEEKLGPQFGKRDAPPDDSDIDCPLFNVLQRWVVEQFGVAPKDAKEYARNFMRNYWLTAPHMKLSAEQQVQHSTRDYDEAFGTVAVFRDKWGVKP